jgi:hypothetical protein
VKCLRIIQLTGSTVTKYQVKKQQGIPWALEHPLTTPCDWIYIQ